MSDISRAPKVPEDGDVRSRGGAVGGVDVFLDGAWRRVYRTHGVARGVDVMRFLAADRSLAVHAAKRHYLEVVS